MASHKYNNIISNPLYLPFELFADKRVGYLKVSDDTYEQSIFLDSRIKGAMDQMICFSSEEVDDFLRELKINQDKSLVNIFHISHVGSTFLSKLLGSLDEIKVLREPNILKNFTREYFKLKNASSEYKKYELNSLLQGIIKSFLCGSEPKVLIKHTSSNLNLPLSGVNLGHISQKEILLFTSLQSFISHSITSAALSEDAKENASFRLDQLNKICFSNSFDLSDLEYLKIVSLTWMVELLKIIARKSSNKSALLINFDECFTDVNKEQTMTNILSYIFDGDLSKLQSIMNLKHWNVNSKNGTEFSFNTRKDTIKINKLSAINDIERALNWVENLCHEEPLLLPLLRYIK